MKAKQFLENYDPQIKEQEADNYLYSVDQVVERLEAFEKEQRAGTASAVDTIVSNTVGIQLNDDFTGGKIVMDMDIWDILKKYAGKTISARSKEVDVHIVINE